LDNADIALEFSDEDKRRRVLHLTCCLLPKSHRDSLEVLFSFLNWVASFSHVDEESGANGRSQHRYRDFSKHPFFQ
jgi:hypothetical protein